MLQQIHATPEDRRTTHALLAATTFSFGALAVADAVANGVPGEGVIGALTVLAAAAGFRHLRPS